jgi:20S proteasome subunit alpha 1
MIMASCDDEKGPMLYKCDPAGYYASYRATTAGAKHQEAMNLLEKKLKNKLQLNEEETIEMAIITLGTVLQIDFKPTDVEVIFIDF